MNKSDLLKQLGYSQDFINSFSEYNKSKDNELVVTSPVGSASFVESESLDTTNLEIIFTSNNPDALHYSVK